MLTPSPGGIGYSFSVPAPPMAATKRAENARCGAGPRPSAAKHTGGQESGVMEETLSGH